MMSTDANAKPTPLHSFLSNFFTILSPKKPEKPAVLCLPDECSSDLERIFRHLDEDGDGKISLSELRECMRTVGEELSEEDAETLAADMDLDGDRLLGFEEFAKLVGDEEEEEKGKNLREAFGVYEMEGEDRITPRSLRSTLEQLGQPKSMEECEAMVRRFDLNGDGVISFDEFRVMMC